MEKNIKINAIIIDDELGCITNLQHYLQKHGPSINIIGTGSNLAEVLDKASTQRVDVAFLDVEIFDDNIFNALTNIHKIDFKIVFVTAYEKYAIKAWKVEALDYILKPLAEEDIQACVRKLEKHFILSVVEDHASASSANRCQDKKIIIKQSDKVYILKSNDIFYVSGNGFYSTITFSVNNEEKNIIISKPLNKLEQEYSADIFFRIHKSHIINKNKISALVREDGFSIKMANNKILPVAKRRINDFLSFLNASD